eukprot:TRINITY_DN1462_c0_g1_i2.p2 TRINITY_DN1462_c0_g1~~TRINITY_DN1462_c0_g1_i2.p2  ORF type:complete len:216 (+),score=42.21 TRINITY_DN1462_c0_g1_i2:1102-1749(+)
MAFFQQFTLAIQFQEQQHFLNSQSFQEFQFIQDFIRWLGKHSSQRKIARELSELKSAIEENVIISSLSAMKYDYAPMLFLIILMELQNNQINNALKIFENYNLTPELLKEHLANIQYNPAKIDYFSNISAITKTNLTKQFNKMHAQNFQMKKFKQKDMNLNEFNFQNQNEEIIDDQGESEASEDELEIIEKMKNIHLSSKGKQIKKSKRNLTQKK